jgi:ribosome biogenesis protein Nip4
MKRKGKKKPI